MLRIEFIDTETITMKKSCAVKDIDVYLWNKETQQTLRVIVIIQYDANF